MTDKQIIIDDQTKTIHRLQGECTEKTNAIIALGDKLQAKEQECEGLEYEVGSLENDRDILQDKCDQLKAENKHLNDLLNQALKDYDKAVQTLTEIKVFSQEVYKLTNRLNRDMALFAKEIIQKISEVIE